MKKTDFYKLFRYYVRRFAYNFKILRSLKSISREKYDEKISASLVYGFLSAVAVNFFFQPGHVYSSGATGLAQVITALSTRFLGFTIPVSVTFYAINIPLMILAWYQIGHKFTIFTFITVTMSSLFIQFVPEVTLTDNPIINALFGGVVMGTGIGFALKSSISSGVNGIIMLIAGLTFGWEYALYSMITIFVSSRVTDAVFTKQKRMQAMIITSHPDRVIDKIHNKLHRGATVIHGAEGTYNHEKKAVLVTVITRAEFNEFKQIMKQTDPAAFVSVADNVHILGLFVEE